jgi:hypothetical protein
MRPRSQGDRRLVPIVHDLRHDVSTLELLQHLDPRCAVKMHERLAFDTAQNNWMSLKSVGRDRRRKRLNALRVMLLVQVDIRETYQFRFTVP